MRAPFVRGVIDGHAVVTASGGVSLEGRFAGLRLRGRAVLRIAAAAQADATVPAAGAKGGDGEGGGGGGEGVGKAALPQEEVARAMRTCSALQPPPCLGKGATPSDLSLIHI